MERKWQLEIGGETEKLDQYFEEWIIDICLFFIGELAECLFALGMEFETAHAYTASEAGDDLFSPLLLWIR